MWLSAGVSLGIWKAQIKQNSEFTTVFPLTQQVFGLVRKRRREELSPWLEAFLASGLGELMTFAVGLQRETVNVQAAVDPPYTNGVVEGNVTRLKQIRRAMYGRGNFDLLRIGVLVAA